MFLVYKIVLTARSVKDINKLDLSTKKRIGEKLSYFSSDPLNMQRN